MKKLIVLTIVLSFSSISAFASTGAEKLMDKIQTNFRLILKGEDCEVNLDYNEATSISSGGPIRLDGSMKLGNYEINPHVDIEKAIVADNKIVVAWSNGLSSAKIVIDVAANGKPLMATGSLRKGLVFAKKECKILDVYVD